MTRYEFTDHSHLRKYYDRYGQPQCPSMGWVTGAIVAGVAGVASGALSDDETEVTQTTDLGQAEPFQLELLEGASGAFEEVQALDPFEGEFLAQPNDLEFEGLDLAESIIRDDFLEPGAISGGTNEAIDASLGLSSDVSGFATDALGNIQDPLATIGEASDVTNLDATALAGSTEDLASAGREQQLGTIAGDSLNLESDPFFNDLVTTTVDDVLEQSTNTLIPQLENSAIASGASGGAREDLAKANLGSEAIEDAFAATTALGSDLFSQERGFQETASQSAAGTGVDAAALQTTGELAQLESTVEAQGLSQDLGLELTGEAADLAGANLALVPDAETTAFEQELLPAVTLGELGSAERGLEQVALDEAVLQREEDIAEPFLGVDEFASAFESSLGGSGSTTTTTDSGGNVINDVIAGGLGGLSIFDALSDSGSSSASTLDLGTISGFTF